MSEENMQDIVVDELQDELVEDVEVSDEELDESAAAKEVDGEKVADDAGKEIKKSAPAQAAAPKTKAGMLNAMYSKMSKMKKNEMMKAYEAMCAESVESDEEAIVEGHFDEDLTALVDSEATLSEGFKDKASVIFEAALKSKLSEHVERLEEQYAEELSEETSRIQNDLVEKVDGYLNYVVEQWMEDNKVAIESGLRTEIAENFMSALHGVFVENYIQVPDSKVDLVDELSTKVDELEESLNEKIEDNLSTKVDELEESLNEKIEDNVNLKESVNKLTRQAIIRESSVGLSESQAEKLKSLVEDVDFSDADTFTAKVATIKESYFKETKVEVVAEDTAVESEEVSHSPRMAAYLKALSIK